MLSFWSSLLRLELPLCYPCPNLDSSSHRQRAHPIMPKVHTYLSLHTPCLSQLLRGLADERLGKMVRDVLSFSCRPPMPEHTPPPPPQNSRRRGWGKGPRGIRGVEDRRVVFSRLTHPQTRIHICVLHTSTPSRVRAHNPPLRGQWRPCWLGGRAAGPRLWTTTQTPCGVTLQLETGRH